MRPLTLGGHIILSDVQQQSLTSNTLAWKRTNSNPLFDHVIVSNQQQRAGQYKGVLLGFSRSSCLCGVPIIRRHTHVCRHTHVDIHMQTVDIHNLKKFEVSRVYVRTKEINTVPYLNVSSEYKIECVCFYVCI